MELVLGVDGGQTSVKCLLATTDGHVLGRGEGGPLVHLAAEGGPARLEDSLRTAFAAAWRSAGLAPRSVAAVGLGLTGVPADSAQAQIARDIVARILDVRHIVVQSDAFAALVGAHVGQPGVVVIAGTGSIVLGMNAEGRSARAGGWGWLVADEGSACAIGRSGLLAAFYAHDGVGPETRLTRVFLEHFRVEAPEEIKALIYAPEFGQRGFASLAPLVSYAAEQGDTVSGEIIRQAGHALARQCGAVLVRLAFPDAPVAPVGGAFEHIVGLNASFRADLQAGFPSARVVAPRLTPVYGAIIMALQAALTAPTSSWTDAIPQLQADLS